MRVWKVRSGNRFMNFDFIHYLVGIKKSFLFHSVRDTLEFGGRIRECLSKCSHIYKT